MNTNEQIFRNAVSARMNPPQSLTEALIEMGDHADQFREVVEAQRRKLVADGYPESVSWRMAADMWAGIWGSIGGSR